MELSSSRPSHDLTPKSDDGPDQGPSRASERSSRIDQIPREVGALLLAAGLVTGMLPPPPGPFDISLMLAGGISLWPRGFRTIEGWMRWRFPRAHFAATTFIERYLDDLEHRYPGSTVNGNNTAEPAAPPAASSLAPEATDEATHPVGHSRQLAGTTGSAQG